MSEFDEDQVAKIVELSLAGEDLQPSSTIPLSFAQGATYELLFEKLQGVLHQADVQMLLADLRGSLYEGIDIGDLKSLHLITKSCKKCAAAQNDPQIPMWNVSDPDMVLIADQPVRDREAAGLLVKALKDAGFASNRITLTYLNRCPVKSGEKYSTEEIKNCLGYLHTELQLLKPKLIVPLGLMPLASLLGVNIKLGDVRGEVIWLGPWPIMPTYSPAYVLRSSDTAVSIFEKDIQSAFKFVYGAK